MRSASRTATRTSGSSSTTTMVSPPRGGLVGIGPGARASVRAIDRNVATTLRHNPIHHGEAQPCPLARRLRGKKWVEDMRLDLWGHPDPGIAHRQAHIRARRNPEVLAGIPPGQLDIRGLKGELTAL